MNHPGVGVLEVEDSLTGWSYR